MSDVQVTMVPKDLYYHEVAYVRGLEARNAELVAALEPFAKKAAIYDEPRDHGFAAWSDKERTDVLIGDCRRARTALAETKKDEAVGFGAGAGIDQ